ncbi:MULTISPECIES: hypothetical protein [unclassified Mesorhizobium]|uniref:hypothetical protein n=1 Tax=unclassified Mesorhizobium TaxID=325217 RepID=UPI0033361383
MPTDVPQSVLTKYAVVRAPKAMPVEAERWNFVTRPSARTELWDRLYSLISKDSPSSDFEEVCAKYVNENPVAGSDAEFPKAFDSVIQATQGLPGSELTNSYISILRESPSIFDSEDKLKLFILWLWDQLTARIVSRRKYGSAGKFIQAIAYLQAKAYADSLAEDAVPCALSVRPEVLMPQALTEFIRAARHDLRREQEESASKISDAANDKARSEAASILCTAALHKFFEDALDAMDFAEIRSEIRTDRTAAKADAAENASGGVSRQPLRLSDSRLKQLAPELVDFARAKLGIEIVDVDPIHLNHLLSRRLADTEAKLVQGATLSVAWRASEFVRTAAAEIATDVRNLPSAVERLILTIGTDATYTLPDFKNPNQVRVAGLCDLKVVRQQLQKYILGEVAYIENVLKGEERSRTHHRLDRTEQQIIIEIEESSSIERDLQTTDRFELTQELDNVQKENRSSDMGVNVTASYGAVTVAAHANATSTQSAENAEKVARSTVKENIARAVEKVQKSTKRQQTITVTTEVTEDNIHRFTATSDSVIGVYRYVEKQYWAQVFNYGARLMLEFLVPEPAASYLFYQGKSPRSGDAHLIAPEQPNFTADQITESNYLSLSARYNAQVTAPPPAFMTGYAMVDHMKKDDADPSIDIDTSYEAIYASPAMYMIWTDPQAQLAVILGGNYWYMTTIAKDPIHGSTYMVHPLRGKVMFHVQPFRAISAWMVGITLVTRRTQEAFGKWRLDTYRAILEAYNLAKDDYDKKLAASRSNSRNITLRSDIEYRNTEQQELKRGVLEILTNQHFNSMGAENVSKDGEPVLDPAKALAEGPTVQFFEQGFEWPNMVYTFYPYFWGRHDTWEDRLSVSDADPIFSRFLSAGYARVVVPVRRYFENNIKYYLEHGDIWEGDDCPVPGDADYVAIVDEIKSIEATSSPDLQDGVPDGDPWRIALPTPLVCLDDPKVKLPSWEIVVPSTTPYVPSVETCNGIPYNAAQWPDHVSIMAELKALGYGVPADADPAKYLESGPGTRVVKAFQRRMNQLGIADALGAPLKLDGIAGPCTCRALTLANEWRRLKQWPGPV